MPLAMALAGHDVYGLGWPGRAHRSESVLGLGFFSEIVLFRLNSLNCIENQEKIKKNVTPILFDLLASDLHRKMFMHV